MERSEKEADPVKPQLCAESALICEMKNKVPTASAPEQLQDQGFLHSSW